MRITEKFHKSWVEKRAERRRRNETERARKQAQQEAVNDESQLQQGS
jgi:hypothetical protein